VAGAEGTGVAGAEEQAEKSQKKKKKKISHFLTCP
jgi:hypothetical protein